METTNLLSSTEEINLTHPFKKKEEEKKTKKLAQVLS